MKGEIEPVDVDFMVIGHGMAGLMSASILASRGYDVAVVGKGATSTSLSTGCITVHKKRQHPLSASSIDLQRLSDSVYPYSLSGGDAQLLRKELSRLEDFFFPRIRKQRFDIGGAWNKGQLLTNNIGTVYHCSMGPSFTLEGGVQRLRDGPTALLGLLGYQVFDPDLASRTLTDLLEDIRVHPYWMRVSELGSRNHFGSSEVERISSEVLLSEIVEGVSDLSEDRVGLPPLFGLKDYAHSMSRIEQETGKEVFEVVTPLSIPGRRLQEALENMAREEGVRLFTGWAATECEIRDQEVEVLTIEDSTRLRRIRLSGLVMAAGDSTTRNKVFTDVSGPLGVFRYQPVQGHWEGSEPAGLLHEKVRAGVQVDERLHLMVDSHRHARNAVAAGGILPDFSFAGGVGLGGVMYSALKAAESIQEAV